ncbi:hypothetical protein L7F22_063429 [Adiantum nelumboides]|nr:hypothetical protein [Adiantum nelumboides]
MDLNGLEGGTTVTARFPGLLPEFAPHVDEIGRCMGFVVGDAVIPEDEDRTISIRMVLYPSLAKNPPQIISLPTIHGGEILQRVFFIGLPKYCFICGKKGHVAAACTRLAGFFLIKDSKLQNKRHFMRMVDWKITWRRENVSPLPSDTTSSSSLHDPPPDFQGSDLDISSNSEGINSAYERHFPSLVEIAKKSTEEKSLKTPNRSSRLNP